MFAEISWQTFSFGRVLDLRHARGVSPYGLRPQWLNLLATRISLGGNELIYNSYSASSIRPQIRLANFFFWKSLGFAEKRAFDIKFCKLFAFTIFVYYYRQGGDYINLTLD